VGWPVATLLRLIAVQWVCNHSTHLADQLLEDRWSLSHDVTLGLLNATTTTRTFLSAISPPPPNVLSVLSEWRA
jgi:hypothetical protein